MGTPSHRRLQSVVTVPTISDAACKTECYDDCYCRHTAASSTTSSRRAQSVVNWGQRCNNSCNGGGVARRLQSVVTYRTPSCTQRCFDSCYYRVLRARLTASSSARRAQVVMSNEQIAAATCASECNQTSGELTSPNPSTWCQTDCVCASSRTTD